MLSQANGNHLEDSAAEVSGEIRMRFYSVDQDNSVRSHRGLAEEHLNSVFASANVAYIHACVDAHAHSLFGDAILGKNMRLSFRASSAMTAHRGYAKRPRPGIRQRTERAGNNFLQICDATASNGNCNAVAKLNLLEYFC